MVNASFVAYFVMAFLWRIVDHALVQHIHSCKWDEKIFTLTTLEDKDASKEEVAMEKTS